ncbi:hypothetical protein HMSSN036_46980 [Paenibacillus macerans]|nr:hypothetical protein HMSSN036_46980 [Paenibacillus macerans]
MIRSDRFLRAADLADLGDGQELAEWKTVVWDAAAGKPEAPNGSEGFRWDQSSRWNLDLNKPDGTPIDPQLTFIQDADEVVQVDFPYLRKKRAKRCGAVSRSKTCKARRARRLRWRRCMT